MAVFFYPKIEQQKWSLASVALRDAYTWHNGGYVPTLVKFELSRLAKKRLPVLTADELWQVVKEYNLRDKAIVLFMGIVNFDARRYVPSIGPLWTCKADLFE